MIEPDGAVAVEVAAMFQSLKLMELVSVAPLSDAENDCSSGRSLWLETVIVVDAFSPAGVVLLDKGCPLMTTAPPDVAWSVLGSNRRLLATAASVMSLWSDL